MPYPATKKAAEKHGRAVFIMLAAMVAVPCVSSATSVPPWDSTYIPHDDLQTYNYRILNQKLGVEVPLLSTAQSTPYVRVLSNGNDKATAFDLTDPVKWQEGVSGGDFNPTQSAAWWWGLEYAKHTDAVNRVLTAGEVLSAIQTLDLDSVTPVFAFDQNQAPNTRPVDPIPPGWPTTGDGVGVSQDIWLKGRVILLNPAAIPANPDTGKTGLDALLGMTAAQVDSLVAGLVPNLPPPNESAPPPSDFAPGGNASALVFYYRESTFNDYPDQAFNSTHSYTNNWAWLPGIYVVTEDGNTYTADNNGQGSRGDWGGYFPDMDLSLYPDYAFLLEIQAKFDNDGQEELYIIGGMPRPPSNVIPEPLTLVAVSAGLAGLVRYARRRMAR